MAESDPVYLADKPKRPRRLPVWLDRDEQRRLLAVAADIEDMADNITGRQRDYVLGARRRHDCLFGLIQHSGLRISEALALKVRDVQPGRGTRQGRARDRQGRQGARGAVAGGLRPTLGQWVASTSRKGDYVFAKSPGERPPTARAVRLYLRRLVERADIDKPVTPHKLRHTYATRLLESGAELVDIQALLGHVSLSTTQIYTHVGEDRMADVVSRLPG